MFSATCSSNIVNKYEILVLKPHATVTTTRFNANDNTNENKFNDLQNMLDRVNLDEVSPKDALDILYAMKKNF